MGQDITDDLSRSSFLVILPTDLTDETDFLQIDLHNSKNICTFAANLGKSAKKNALFFLLNPSMSDKFAKNLPQ